MKNRRQGQSQVMTKDEIKRVIQYQKHSRHSLRNICLISFSFLTGCRVGEISKLKIQDVVNEDWSIKNTTVLRKEYTKTNQTRVIYLVDEKLRKSLEKYITHRRATEKLEPTKKCFEQPLFISQKKGGFTPRTLQRLFKNMYRGVGLDEMVSSHSGRRTYICNLISAGIDMKTVSTLAGHSSIQTTVDTYAVANPNKLENVSRNLSIF
tara:strand:+ start:199 stop:822 length:624 start_codon:yes stop_codon:yes gene_type:complete